jgi:hypothetical protein
MKSLTPVYFPGTDIYSIRQYPVFLLFQKIHLIWPVEDDPTKPGQKLSDTFINSGFCQVHTPCPLGNNRGRFLHLVDDIRKRKDDYTAQLSSLTLAAMTRSNDNSEDSETSILSSLLSPGVLEAKAELEKREEKLWQARLVLAIGEILDIEDEEIARNLAVLEDEQAGLFRQLHGDGEAVEDDSPFAELIQLESHLSSPHSGNINGRFKSWKTLYLESSFDGGEMFFTPSKAGGDIMLELYEKMTGKPAHLLQGLELPGLIGWSGKEALKTVKHFCRQNNDLLGRLHSFLADLSVTQDYLVEQTEIEDAFTETAKEWCQQLESHFSTAQFGRIPVNLYIFPAVSCKTVVGGKKEDNDSQINGLLVVAG